MAGLPLPYLVTAPGRGKRLVSLSAAVACAMDYASRDGSTAYVRDETEEIVGYGHGDGNGRAVWIEVVRDEVAA